MALDITLRSPGGADVWLTDQPTITPSAVTTSTTVGSPSLQVYPGIQAAGGVSASTSISAPSLNVYPSIDAAGGVSVSTSVSAPDVNVYPGVLDAQGASAGTSVGEPAVVLYPDIGGAGGISVATAVSAPDVNVYPGIDTAGGISVATSVAAPDVNVYPGIDTAGGISVTTTVSDPLSVVNRVSFDIVLRWPSNADVWLTDGPAAIGATAGNTSTSVGLPSLASPVASTPFMSPNRGPLTGGTPVFCRTLPNQSLRATSDESDFNVVSPPAGWATSSTGSGSVSQTATGLILQAPGLAGASTAVLLGSRVYTRGHVQIDGSFIRPKLPVARLLYTLSLWLNIGNHVDASVWGTTSNADSLVVSKTVNGATQALPPIALAQSTLLERISMVKRQGDVYVLVDGAEVAHVASSYAGAVAIRLSVHTQKLTVNAVAVGSALLLDGRLLTNMEDAGSDRLAGVTPASREPVARIVDCVLFGPWGESRNDSGFTYTWPPTTAMVTSNGTSIASN